MFSQWRKFIPVASKKGFHVTWWDQPHWRTGIKYRPLQALRYVIRYVVRDDENKGTFTGVKGVRKLRTSQGWNLPLIRSDYNLRYTTGDGTVATRNHLAYLRAYGRAYYYYGALRADPRNISADKYASCRTRRERNPAKARDYELDWMLHDSMYARAEERSEFLSRRWPIT